jgi:hypothetical protein
MPCDQADIKQEITRSDVIGDQLDEQTCCSSVVAIDGKVMWLQLMAMLL